MVVGRRELLRLLAGGAAATALSGCATRLRPPDTESEAMTELAKTVAYCGLVCGVCRNAVQKGCKGCRSGGGDENCHQRKCCTTNGLDGCWQCATFPCNKGFFADEVWRGLCIGSVQCIKDYGTESYVERLVSRLGKDVEYGEYRFRDPQEIRTILCGD